MPTEFSIQHGRNSTSRVCLSEARKLEINSVMTTATSAGQMLMTDRVLAPYLDVTAT